MAETGWTSFVLSWAAFPLLLLVLTVIGVAVIIGAVIIMIFQNQKISEDKRSGDGSR